MMALIKREYVKDCEACSRFDSPKIIQPIYINHITKKYDLFMMDCVDFRRYSFKNPLSRSIIVENETSTMVPAIDVHLDIVLVEENAADTEWYLEIALIDIMIPSDVAKHSKNYRERILESNNSNKLKRDLSIGDQFLIKKRLRYEY
ncbi:hypothetical protein CWI39_2407p0010 [Hamiltosporidium magnivora]|uniref:Uncharacterized protein n=1 Tax=Hamiltosporidium magnivora TaxID=148818 RepID=A0A4Q9KUH4_9MICR|nr:hypothetical protein CWI39_2407p0010 [Hamiltosporidium magnivora]